MRRALVIANGELDGWSADRLRAAAVDWLVAVDGGAEHCRALGLLPNLIVGDLDSVTPDTLTHFTEAGVRVERHPRHKDETDLELALFAVVEEGVDQVIVAAAMGGRVDMTLANALLLAHPRLGRARVELWQGRSSMWLLRPPGGEVRGGAGDVVSLIPLQGNAEGLVTEGLDYPLRDEALCFAQTRGVSNVLTGTSARVGLRAGVVLVVHTARRH